jgi:hypothetical protein
MPRDAGLVDIDVFDDVVDRMLACPEDLNDAEPGGVGKDLERNMHLYAYVSLCIYAVNWNFQKFAEEFTGVVARRSAGGLSDASGRYGGSALQAVLNLLGEFFDLVRLFDERQRQG